MNTRIELLTGVGTQLQQLFQLVRELNEHHDNMGPFFHVTPDSLVEDFKAQLFKAAFLYLNDDTSTPVGFLLFSGFYRQRESLKRPICNAPLEGYYLDQYYVVPQLRGQGLGTLLIRWLCHWIATNGGSSLSIIYHCEQRLHDHYDKLGFENFTTRSPHLQLYEICGVSSIQPLLSLEEPADEDVSCQVTELSATCEQVTLTRAARQLTFLNQLVHTAWMGKAQWINEIRGDVTLLSPAILLRLIQTAWKRFGVPLHCVWIECSLEENMSQQLYQSTLEGLDFENITETEGWNFSVLSGDNVAKLARQYQLQDSSLG